MAEDEAIGGTLEAQPDGTPARAREAEPTAIDVVEDFSLSERLAFCLAKAEELAAECSGTPEKARRIRLIRDLMLNRWWLPDGGGYDKVLGPVWNLSPATIRADASDAHRELTYDVADPERKVAAGIVVANRARDWAQDAKDAGRLEAAAKLLEIDAKVSGHMATGPSVVINQLVAANFDPKSGELSEAGKARVREEVAAVVGAAIEAVVVLLPEAEREAARDAAWDAARVRHEAGATKMLEGKR